MANLTWSGAAKNGNWDDPLNWSINGQPAGRIPGSGDDIDMGGAPHLPFPTLSSNATVNSLVVNESTFVTSGATLDVAGSLSVVASTVDMSFDVAGTAQAGSIANLDTNGVLTGGQRAHFVIEAGGTLIDRDTPGAASPIDTLLTNVSLGAGSKFEVFDGSNLVDITASLFNVSGTATLTNELSLNAHNTPFLNPINVISNGLITLVNDDFRAAELFIDASSIVGGVGSIAVTAQSITNNGQLWSESQGTSSLVIANDVVGTGTVRLFDGSTLEFKGAVASSETINFDAPETGEKLIVDAVNASGFAATLHGFTTLDTIDLTHTAATSAVLDGSDMLAFRDKNGATVATLQLTGDYAGKTFLVSGDGGTGSLLTAFTNALPVTTAPASEIVSKGTPFAFTGTNLISVADPDASSGSGENITVVLTDTTGLLSAFVAGSGGGANISGNGSQQLTISGGLGQVNAALATLSFLGNTVGSDQVDVATNDGRGGSDDHKIVVSVVANQPPATTAPVSEVASKGTPLAFTGADQISVADPDAQSGPGENITVVLTDTAGLLSAFVAGSGGGASVAGSGTQQLTISGGLGQVNAALATLSFLGNTLGPDQIDVATSDGRGGSDDHKIAVSVVANQPPVTAAPASELVSRNTPFAFTGADQISVSDADAFSPPGETITVVLTDTSGLLSAFVPGSGGTAHITGSGTQQLTISGGLNQVNAALASLSFVSNTLGPDQIDVASSDGRGGSDDHKIAVSVVANQPPVTTVPASETVSKGTPFAFTGADQISVADPDAQTPPGENITVVLTDTFGQLSAFVSGSGGAAHVTGSGTQQLTISGGLNQVNAALSTLSFLGNTVGPDQIDVATSDGRGGSDDHKIAVTVTPSTNVPFLIVAPSAALTGVNQAGSISGISLVENPTTPGEIFSIAISDANGALSASTVALGGGGTIVNSGANTLTITGTLDQVNADLTTLTDTNTSTAPDSLFMLASNSNGENAPVVSVDVTVNGAPTITTPSDVRAPAGLATPVPLMKVSETGNTAGEFFVVILSDVNGLLSATFGGSPVFGSGTNHLTLSGSLDQVNAELASLTITETSVGLDFITGGVGDGFGNASGQFMIPVVGEKNWTSTSDNGPENWNNAANWTTPGAPVAGQDIFIPGTGIQPVIFNGASGTIGGIVTNNGTITLEDSAGLQTTLLIDGNVFLGGTGSVLLSDSSANSITTLTHGASLENGQTIEGAGLLEIVSGSFISLTFHNDFNGTINATGTNALVFDGFHGIGTLGLVANDGLIEASGTGGLALIGTDVTNNGVIQANNGSHIDLNGLVTISGGTLSTNGTGVIQSVFGPDSSDILAPQLDGSSNGELTNLGTIAIGATYKLAITGTINNFGTINLLGDATQSATLFIGPNVTLQGPGAVVLSDSALNSITSLGTTTLENRQTIEGAGLLDVVSTSLTLQNDFNGTINATGINALEIVGFHGLGSSGLVANDGLMEASGAGGLTLLGENVTNNGIIQANNGSHIDLNGLVRISGGTLSTNGTGVIQSVAGDGFSDNAFLPWLDGVSNGALTNLGTVEIGATDKLNITGTINNFGTINLLGDTKQSATLFIGPNALLEGTGAIVLSDSALNSITSVNGAAVLENGQTIEGAGLLDIVSTSLTLQNDFNGTINATGINALEIVGFHGLGSSGLVANDGLMEASGAGGLTLLGENVTNNGIIQANNGSHIDLNGLVRISGGTLSTNGTGVIQSVAGDGFSDNAFLPWLDGVSNGALTNLGTVEIGATDKLNITGTINNFGTINLLGDTTQSATLFIGPNALLEGTGAVVLSDSALNSITSVNGAAVLENGQTIEGAGLLDVVSTSLTLQNDFNGIINATDINALMIAPGNGFASGQVINDGLMEASGAGGLVFAQEFVTNNGTIQANNGSHVDLEDNTVISGGTLRTIGTGVIRSVSAADRGSGEPGPTLDGVSNGAVTNLGTIELGNGNTLRIDGTIANEGTINLLGTSTNSASLLVSGNATLIGDGTVQLSDSNLNTITPDTIFNANGNSNLNNFETISGAGTIIAGAGSNPNAVFTLHNEASGVIDATGTNALTFDSALFDLVRVDVINDGLMEASGAGGLVFAQAFVTNNGTIQADNGSHVDLENRSVISGGTLRTTGTGVIRSESAADTGLGRPGPTLDGVSNGALTNLGTIEIGNGNTLRIDGAIANDGIINLLGSASLLISSNATLIGDGTVQLSDSNLNTITPDTIFNSNGNSNLNNFETISGAGTIIAGGGSNPNAIFTLHNEASGVIDATGINALTFDSALFDLVRVDVINDGLMAASGAGGLVFAQAFVTNNGTIQANNGSHVDLENRSVISGGTLRTIGTGVIQSESAADTGLGRPGPTLDGVSNGALTNLGTIEIGNGNTLRIDGTIANEGTINLLGTSTSSASLLVSSNATLIGDGTVQLSDSRLNTITPDTIFNNGNSNLNNFETISGAGTIIAGGGSNPNAIFTLHNEASGVIDATGTNALKFDTALFDLIRVDVINDGLMEASGAGGLDFVQTFVTNNGTIQANNGSHVDFANAGLWGAGGQILIDANATATLSNTSVGSGQIIQFLKGANETLVLDDATVNTTTIGAHISGFAIGDAIDLAQLKITSASLDTNAMLHLFNGIAEVASLQLDTSNLGERFVAASDGGTGTRIAVVPVTPPQVTEALARDTGASATDGITNDPTLQGNGDPFAIVSFTENGAPVGTTTADVTGAWSFTPTNLSQGPHTIIASETNAAGTGQATLTFTYDSLAPHMAITTPDAQIANPQLTLSGTGEVGTQVQLFDNALNIGGSVLVDATGHWSEQITLVGTGTHFITAADTDLAGNFGSSGVATFTLDNQIVAPITQTSVAGTTGADHITISQSNILVSAGAGNDTITLTAGGNFQFHFLNGGPGNDTLDLSQIAGNVTANLAQDTLVGSQVGFSFLNSIENIIAGTGNERLIGSSGANVFQAGAGTDTLTGNGGGDTFVFKPDFGKAVITDFHVATTNANPHDLIELDHSLFSQFATVQALLASTEVTQSGSSVVIAADPAHTIELQHTSLRTLVAHANDVLFV